MWSLVSRSTEDGIQVYDIKPGVTTLGRVASNTICITDPLASRYHAEIRYDPGKEELKLKDLGSKNGTFYNGRQMTEDRVLVSEDQIRIGHKVFEVHQRGVKTKPGEEKVRVRTRPLTSELVLHSIDRHTILLNDIAERLNTVADLDSAIAEVTALAKKVLAVDRCNIILAAQFDQLKILGLPRAITRPAIEEQLVVLIRGPQKEQALGDTGMLQGVKSALCVPVLIKKNVAAVFYMDKTSEAAPPFTELETELAVGISHQLAMAIQRKQIEAELLKNALYDSLTVLPNQSLFVSYLEKAAERASREKEFNFAVIAMDLDNFKLVNDFHGYTMGDEALLLLARRLNGFLREHDTLARMDGDEFAILVHGVTQENDALKVAESLHKTISKPITLNDFQVNLSAGIGICMGASGFEKPIDLLRNAETAMYRAKEKGQAGTAVFNAHMRDRSIARLNLESKLSQAIANQEFVVNYQPIVSVESSSIVGFEALVRWKQTTGSLIAASDFISLAEDTQFIFAIDMIVMQAACRQLKDWQQRFKAAESLWMSVNLSSRHIANRELIGAVQQVLDDSKLAANFLNLEFTEKTLMEENGESIVVLNQLREMGLQLSIDDFGTGYSSLSYLRHFPVNFIKLDRSFTIEGDWEIATLITDLAHKLELKVVAEGVEKQEQMDHLREIQCDFAQGNLFSAEMNPDKAELLLAGEGRLEPA